MKKKEKIYSIALASTVTILFLVLVSSMASALPTPKDPRDTTVPEITSGSGDPSNDRVLSEDLFPEGIGTAHLSAVYRKFCKI